MHARRVCHPASTPHWVSALLLTVPGRAACRPVYDGSWCTKCTVIWPVSHSLSALLLIVPYLVSLFSLTARLWWVIVLQVHPWHHRDDTVSKALCPAAACTLFCAACRPGYGGSSCTKCTPGTYSRGGAANDAAGACQPCPNGMTSPEGALAEGWCSSKWSFWL
jgi:hypothetical protein